jgi:uncharacterized membrane protein
MRRLRGWLVTGILVTLPVAFTAYVLWQMFWKLDTLLGPIVTRYLGIHVPGLGLLALVTILLVVGAFASNILGRRFVDLGDRIVHRIPLINTIYRAVKQIAEAVLADRRGVFREVVLVEFPRKGCYSLGFLTSRGKGEIQAKTAEDVVNVFLPTTPNPTSGYLLMVPVEDVHPLSMSIEDGMKLVISGGSVSPPWPEGTPAWREGESRVKGDRPRVDENGRAAGGGAA